MRRALELGRPAMLPDRIDNISYNRIDRVCILYIFLLTEFVYKRHLLYGFDVYKISLLVR